jgi:hypothetical protein
MGLLDIDVEVKKPITEEYLRELGFKKHKKGYWEWKVYPSFLMNGTWVIRYSPRGTYDGVRLRSSRLVFKDVNYLKYEKTVNKPKNRFYKVTNDYCPRVPQIVIHNPGVCDIDMCYCIAKKNVNDYNSFVIKNGDKAADYESWLKMHNLI